MDYVGGSAGSTWQSASVSGEHLIVIPNTGGHTLYWHSADDEAGVDAGDYELRLTPYDVQTGTAGLSGLFSVNNNEPPVVSNVVPSGSTESILITYDLTDRENHLADIVVEYIGGSRSSWTAADVTGSATIGLAPGSHSVTWLSGVNQGGQTASNYRIRITPSDVESGSAGTSLQFFVTNP